MANPELTRQPSRFDARARAAIRKTTPTSAHRVSAARKLARGMGWFSIGLGLIELLAARRMARGLGLDGRAGLVRACGMREIATGVGLLTAHEAQAAGPWAWGRVAGDAMDLTALAAAAATPGSRRAPPLAAMVAVAGVGAVDVVCAQALQREAQAAGQRTDYSDRRGLGPQALPAPAAAAMAATPDVAI